MKRHVPILALVIAATLLGSFSLVAVPVSAHEHVTAGEYELTVGWRDEPAVANSLNGLDLGIQQHFANNTTAWVVGVEGNLTAVLSTGPYSYTYALAPQSGRDGWYTFDVLPTRAGRYTVRLTGVLGSTAVNKTVIMDDVSPAGDLAFPIPDPSPSELQSGLAQANAQIAALQGQLTAALAVGIVGILMALSALVAYARLARSQRKTP